MHTINDPRVVESSGGGISPEQHFGTLTDGSVFYLRMRWGWAELKVGPPGTDKSDLPLVNPDWNRQDAEAAYDAGRVYLSFFLGPMAEVHVYPDREYAGCFDSDADRDQAFKTCLDRIWKDDGVDYSQR